MHRVALHVTLSQRRWEMIRAFADADTRELFETGRSKSLLADIVRRALRKLEYVDNAALVTDLRLPPGNRLHTLKGAFA